MNKSGYPWKAQRCWNAVLIDNDLASFLHKFMKLIHSLILLALFFT